MSNLEISLNEINLVCEIIKICTKRGAFSAEELEEVGKLYNKFNSILKDQIEKQKQNVIKENESRVNSDETNNT